MKTKRQKYISVQELRLLAPTTLHEGKVMYNLQQHYCPAMHMSGHCSEDCKNCQPYLQKIIQQSETPEARNPYALMVYVIRETVAEIREKKLSQELLTDWLGRPRNENPFLLLLELLQ